MPEEPNQQDDVSAKPDAQEKQVAKVAIRLPILILIAVLLMLGVGIWAQMR
jgi:hypothetical protein